MNWALLRFHKYIHTGTLIQLGVKLKTEGLTKPSPLLSLADNSVMSPARVPSKENFHVAVTKPMLTTQTSSFKRFLQRNPWVETDANEVSARVLPVPAHHQPDFYVKQLWSKNNSDLIWKEKVSPEGCNCQNDYLRYVSASSIIHKALS